MDQRINNHFKGGNIEGDYVGGNQTKNYYISMFQDSEREFVVTHNADIKPVSYFTGRETELQELRQRIEEGRKSVLVSGMGGIGKTHICRKLFEEYLNKHADGENIPFRHIGYIEYAGDMSGSLMNCLKYRQQDDPEQNREAAWRELEYLAADGKFLFFVDNVNVPIGEDAGLGRLKQIPGAVVMTSRRTSFGKEFEPYRIGFLDTEHCMVIYERIRYENSGKKVPEEEISDLEYVIDVLVARHTITIEFLAHLSETKCWSAKRLREELESKGFRLEYKDEEDKLINIQEEYEKLYDLSELSAAEQNILEAFSVFPYIPLEAKICNQWLLEDAGVGEGDDILVGLYRKGWLQYDIGQESYVLHPVFAQFVFEKCRPDKERHTELIIMCKNNLQISKDGSAFICLKYMPFAENIIKKLGADVDFLENVAYIQQYVGEFGSSIETYKKVIKIKYDKTGENCLDMANCYNELAGVYSKQGEYKKAKELYRRALKIREELIGEFHPDTAKSYLGLAEILGAQGKYKEAQELLWKAVRIQEELLGEFHLDTAMGYGSLAWIYSAQGKYAEAEELYKRVLIIRLEVIGEDHPNIAAVYNNLAWVYDKQGKYDQAQRLYDQALKIFEGTLGNKHPDTAKGYNNLAYIYKKQEKYKEAEELYRKTIKINKEMLGENHPEMARCYSNLAYVYEEQKEYDKAEQLFKEALYILKGIFDARHPDLAIAYNNLAGNYENQGRFEQAQQLYERALKINKEVLGEHHPNTVVCYNNIACLYYNQQQYKKAEEVFEKVLRIRKEIFGENHLDTANCYNNLAGTYYVQRKYIMALECFVRAFKTVMSIFGLNHSNTQIIYRNLRYVYKECNPKGNFEQWLEEKMKE